MSKSKPKKLSKLKKLSKRAIPKAIDRAMRYRLLNDPALAESICLDVLAIAPENQQALYTLILALTDQCGTQVYCVGNNRAEDFIEQLTDEYERFYLTGLLHERKAKASLSKRMAGTTAYQLFREAMEWYEKAEPLRPRGNDAVILRWNTCLRIIQNNRSLKALTQEMLRDDTRRITLE